MLDKKLTEGSKFEDESYDREAILLRLAKLKNFSVVDYVTKIEESRRDSIAVDEESSETYKPRKTNEEDTNDESPGSRVDILREVLKYVPDSLLHLMTGSDRPGDCGRSLDQKPDWLDEEKLRRGQKFAQDHYFPIHFADLISLFAVFSFEDSFKPLIITGKSSTSYTAFKRYLSTGLRVRNWYTQDLWAEGNAARKDMKIVRAMHAGMKRKLDALTVEEIDAAAKIPNAFCPAREILLKDFSEACEAPGFGQCPYMLMRDNPDRPKGLNQSDMALTQWVSMGLIISYPKYFGVHYATDEDLEAYCHLWWTIGYQLGIEDEFNFCRGTLKDVRHRSSDLLEAWVKPNFRQISPEWEHLMRSLTSGMSVIFPGMSYEVSLLFLTEILGLHMPRFYASVSYKDWINYNLLKFLFNHATKIPGLIRLLNSIVNSAYDRAARLTPKELEAVRIELSKSAESQKDFTI